MVSCSKTLPKIDCFQLLLKNAYSSITDHLVSLLSHSLIFMLDVRKAIIMPEMQRRLIIDNNCYILQIYANSGDCLIKITERAYQNLHY